MNLGDLIQKISRLGDALEKERDRILTEASQKLLADMQERIFDEGKASDGSPIGKYSTEPIYVPVPYPQVKNSGLKRVGKTGKNTKATQYFGGGYKEFRKEAGRESEKVNLDLTGSLRISMKIADYQNGKAIYVDQKDSIVKIQGNEDRFGKRIFKPTEEEAKEVRRIIAKNVNKIMKQTLT